VFIKINDDQVKTWGFSIVDKSTPRWHTFALSNLKAGINKITLSYREPALLYRFQFLKN
jgi:hypothetical protein